MPIDTEQLDVDLEAVRALPDWQDEGKRRGLIRSLSANSYAAQDPEQHQAFTSKLWEAADPRSTLQKAGEFIGSATEEVVKSIPAVPAAAALAITDATGQTDTGSGFRLQRGVMDLAEQGFQRAKQFAVGEGAVGATLNTIMGAARLAGLPVPASAQAERDQTLTALKQDIDTGAVPDSVARWLAGADVGDDPDVKQWQDGLSRGLGEAALKAQGMGTVQPEALDAWLKSDRNPLRGGINDDNTDFSTRDMLADYLATRDPQSWNAFTNRVAETNGQYQTRIGRAVREGTQLKQMGQNGLMGELLGRGADMQGSPIDLASAALPLLRGMKLLKAVKEGASGLRGIAAGMGEEFAQEAGTEYLGDARASDMQVLEAGGMGAVGSGVLEGGFATAGRVLRNRPNAELPPMQTGNPQIDQVNAVLRASGPRPNGPISRTGIARAAAQRLSELERAMLGPVQVGRDGQVEQNISRRLNTQEQEEYDFLQAALDDPAGPQHEKLAAAYGYDLKAVNQVQPSELPMGNEGASDEDFDAFEQTRALASQRPPTTPASPFASVNDRNVPANAPASSGMAQGVVGSTPAAGTDVSFDPAEILRRRRVQNEQYTVYNSDGDVDRAASQAKRNTAAAAAGLSRGDWETQNSAANTQAKKDFFAALNKGDEVSWTDSNGKSRTGKVEVSLNGEKQVRDTTEGSAAQDFLYGWQTGEFDMNSSSLSVKRKGSTPPTGTIPSEFEYALTLAERLASQGDTAASESVIDLVRTKLAALTTKQPPPGWFLSGKTPEQWDEQRAVNEQLQQQIEQRLAKPPARTNRELGTRNQEPVPSIDNIGTKFAPPQVRTVPVIPDNPLGYRDSLDFLNEMPIAISRSGTGGELDWQETANIPKYYRPFIANEQGLPIDVVAEAAYEANLIPQPTADALMKRVQEDIGARRTYRVQGREQKAELLTREKQTVSFDKSQTKLGNKATAVQVPFDSLATGDQLTIDGEQVTVRAVESDEDGYLTKVVLEDGKKFGVQEFNPQSREGVFVDAFDPKPRLAGEPEVFSPAQTGDAVPSGLTEAEVKRWRKIEFLAGKYNLDLSAEDRPFDDWREVWLNLRNARSWLEVAASYRRGETKISPGAIERFAKQQSGYATNAISNAEKMAVTALAKSGQQPKPKMGFRLLGKVTKTPWGSRYYHFDYKGQWWYVRVADHANTANRAGIDDNTLGRYYTTSGMSLPQRLNIVLDEPASSDAVALAYAKSGVEAALEQFGLTKDDADNYYQPVLRGKDGSITFDDPEYLQEQLAESRNEKAQSTPLTGQAGESRLDMLGRGPSKTEQSKSPPSTAAVNPNLNPAALESPARGLGRGLGAILGQPPPGAATSQRPTTTAPANAPAMSQALFDRARAVTSQQALPPVELEELFTRARNLLANDGSMELRPSDRTVIPQALAKLAAGENPQLIVNQWKEHRNQVLMGRTTAATPFAEYAQATTDPGTPRARLLSAYAQLDRTGQGYVRIPDLVRASGLPIADVREVLIDLSDRNQAYLTPADEPRNIPAGDRSLLVVGPSGPSLYVTLPNPAALASPAQLTAQDAAYMAAVEAGDIDKAWSMVVAAAKKAGLSDLLFHGTDSEFTEFDAKKAGSRTRGPKANLAFWFTESENHSLERGSISMPVFLKYENPLTISELTDTFTAGNIVERAKNSGHDAVIFEKLDDLDGSSDGVYSVALIVNDKVATQIKSADPVTRDEQGNVIPLSQRFNSDSDSILYSPPTVSSRTVYKRNTTLNKAELARLGLPTDTGKSVQGQKPVKEALSRIAKDKRLPVTVRRMAKELQNADLSGLYFQVVADGRKQYTGLYQPLRGGQGELVVNLRHLGRGNVDPALNMAETLVHEVLHHATYRALRGPKNDVQRAAIGNLEQLRRRVKAVLGSQQMADFDYQTKNIDEFIAALFTQKPFQDALAAIPAEATPKSLVQQVRTMLDEAFRLLAEIVTGKKVPPGSVLDAAFQNALRLVEDGMRVAGNYQALPGGGMLSRTPSLHGVTPTPLQSVLAHHGTPHKVRKFSLSKIGTGEGAQAYGWGLYFAESKAVAEGYQRKLSVANEYARMALQLKGSRAAAVDYMRSDSWDQANSDVKAAIGELLNDNTQGNLYTVELLPDEGDFLDWDKPLSEQSEKVQAALAAIIDSAAKSFPTLRGNKQASGAGIYQAYASHRGGNAQAASQKLAELGIPGIKYLDGGSRGAGDGTRNYVIFDENLVRILEENGQPISTPPLASPAQPTGQVPSQAVPLKPEFGGAFPGHLPYKAKEMREWADEIVREIGGYTQVAAQVEGGRFSEAQVPFVLTKAILEAASVVGGAKTQAQQISAQAQLNRLRALLNPQNRVAGQALVAQRDALGPMRDRVPGLAVDEALEKAQVQTIDAAIPVQPTVTGLADLTTQASTEATETVGAMLEAEGLGLEEADSTPQEQAAGEAVQSDLEAEVLRLKQMQTAERNQFSRLTTKLQKILATLQAFAGNKGAVIAGVKARLAARRAARANTVAANKLQSLSSPAQGITTPTLPDTALDDGLEVLLTQGIQIDDWKAAMTKKLGPKYASQLTDLYERAVDLYQAELTAAHAEVEKRVKEKKAKQKPTTRPQPQRKPLAQSFPDLAKMLRKLGPAISGLNWRQIMTSTATAQRQWELDTYAQIRQHPRLSALSPEQAKQLTRELSKAWQRERRKVWKRELEKTLIAAGMAKPKHRAKIEASAPRLLSLINLGALNAATFRDAVAKEFRLKSMTDADVLKVKALAEDLQNTPPGVPYRTKAQHFIDGLQDLTKLTRLEILQSYWTAMVLSGWRTQVDIGLGLLNGLEDVGLSGLGRTLRTAKPRVAGEALLGFLGNMPQALGEAMHHVLTGNRSLMKNYDAQVLGALEDGQKTIGSSARALRQRGGWRLVPGWGMEGVARMMTALGHITTSSTYEGAKWLAIANHPDLYLKAQQISAADRAVVKQQARQVLTGGVEPVTMADKLAERRYIMELLDEKFGNPEVLGEAQTFANETALEGDPTGLGMLFMQAVNALTVTAPAMAIKTAEEEKWHKAILWLLRAGAVWAKPLTGTKFARTLSHALNRNMTYVPGVGAVRFGMDAKWGTPKGDLVLAKQMVGLLFCAAFKMWWLGDDEEDKMQGKPQQRGIEGGWENLTAEQKTQNYAAGKKPWHLWELDKNGKIRTVNYQNWGIASLMAALGQMQDRERYQGVTDHTSLIMSGIWTGMFAWMDKAQLQGLQILTGRDSPYSTSEPDLASLKKVNKFAATLVGGAFPRLGKDIDAMIDPSLRKTDEWWQVWARELPVARSLSSGKRHDIFGQDIKLDRGPLSRVYQEVTLPMEYKVLGALNERGVTLPDPSFHPRKVPMVNAPARDMTTPERDRYQRITTELYRAYIADPTPQPRYLKQPDGRFEQATLTNAQYLLKLPPEDAQEAISKATKTMRAQAVLQATKR